MNVILACIHYPVASGKYMTAALRRMGHSVLTVGPSTGHYIWGMQADDKYSWFPDIADFTQTFLPGGIGVVLDDIVVPTGWNADLVLVMDSALTIAQKFDCPKVVYGVDNHVRSYALAGIEFDHYFLAHSKGAYLPVEPGNPKRTWLPCATDLVAFPPSPIPLSCRKFDVCLVGVMYPQRAEIIEAMRLAGLKVLAATGLFYDEYRAAYWNSKISLCASVDHDVAMRVFETGGMGCVLLSDYCHDFGALGLYSGKHYILYSSAGQAAEAARELLQGPPERLAQLADNAHMWAIGQTWEARAATILEVMTK